MCVLTNLALDSDDDNKPQKSEDWNWRFKGNGDDHFRIGIKITRKSVLLFSEFSSSDVIVASPLGLRSLLDDDKYVRELLKNIGNVLCKQRKYQENRENALTSSFPHSLKYIFCSGNLDFLSSIEVCVLDQMDFMAMQNTDHLLFLLKRMNLFPGTPTPSLCSQ